MHHSWYIERQAPCAEACRSKIIVNQVVQQWHDQLGDTATQISPSSSGAIRQAHNFAVEHGAHPKLAGDKSRQGETNEEAHQDEAVDCGNQRHAEHSRSCNHDEHCAAIARADEIANGTHQQPRDDGAGYRCDSGVGNVSLRQVEVVSDDGHQWRRSEGGKETNHEGNPRKMECPHVRWSPRVQLHLGSLVLGIHRKGEFPTTDVRGHSILLLNWVHDRHGEDWLVASDSME